MRVVVLSGGTGTPKLLRGLVELVEDLTVIVNTAEDIWISGVKVCPDIDSVIYALADIIDEEKWWGIRGDSFRTHEQLKRLGFDEFMMIGDLDRATHIFRTELLKRYTLTETTRILKNAFGIKAEILPMCEEEVSTIIVTPNGEMHFQEFWIKYRGEPDVINIYFKGIEKAKATDDVIKALENCDYVIIGPSNPITSIMPILMVKGIKERLKRKTVIAVSPIIGNKPLSGPAGKFMKAKGYEVSPLSVADIYSEFLDILVVDISDSQLVGTYNGIKIVSTKIIMKSKEDARTLSKFILNLIRKPSHHH
ncbi:MAG TPA: 2-phospho-L-lactate transferase [Archaeoglobus profundus]|nr:2-phospho-L-lactate transferase [Archaeoglobus profundus]